MDVLGRSRTDLQTWTCGCGVRLIASDAKELDRLSGVHRDFHAERREDAGGDGTLKSPCFYCGSQVRWRRGTRLPLGLASHRCCLEASLAGRVCRHLAGGGSATRF